MERPPRLPRASSAAIAVVVGSPQWSFFAYGFTKITPFGWTVLAIAR